MKHFSIRCAVTPASGRILTKGIMCILWETLHDQDVLNNVNLLLTEAITNVEKHAYPNGHTGDVEVTLHLDTDDNFVEIFIADWGCGFEGSTTNISQPQLSAPEEEGGRGLFIISSLADHFSVHEQDGKNILHVRIAIKERS